MQLRENVPQQVLGGHGAVLLELAAKGNGVAVDHRANMVALVNLLQRKHPAGAFDRIAGQATDAMGQARADQFLDDVAFQHRPGGDAGAISEERAETVLKIRMQHHALPAKLGQQLHRLAGLRRGRGGVVPARRFEGEILRQVADGGTADAQRLDAVCDRSRLPDHEITQMRLNRGRLSQRGPVRVAFQHRPGFGGGRGSAFLGQTHASIERETGAIETIAAAIQLRVDAGERRDGGIDVIHTDVGVVHYAPIAHRLLLVLEFGFGLDTFEKGGTADTDAARQLPRLTA